MTAPFDYAALRREEDERLEREIDRNERMMELARHNGFEIEIGNEIEPGKKVWFVPEILVQMVGCMGAVVRV